MPKAARRVTQDDIEANFERIQRAHDETERALRESIEDTKALKKNLEETRKALNESIGGLGNTIGNMSESMLIPSLVEKFKQLGFTFEITNRRRKITSDEHDIHTEVDAFLENSTQAMAVEVKTTLRRDEVDYHVERMGKIRRHADLHNDKRQFFGAMAAAVVDDETRRYALNQGFYIIEPSGEDVMIVEPAAAKIW